MDVMNARDVMNVRDVMNARDVSNLMDINKNISDIRDISDILPCKSVIFPKWTVADTAFFSPSDKRLFAVSKSLYSNIEAGQTVLCETVENSQWYGHRIDFLLKRMDDDKWQPYIVEYDIGKPSPMWYDFNGKMFIKKELKKN